MNSNRHDDLDWLAFCYIADELPVNDRKAFEGQLDKDQSAREAVARAVGMTQAISVAIDDGERIRPARKTPCASVVARAEKRPQTAIWLAVVGTLCLALIVATFVASYLNGGGELRSPDSVAEQDRGGMVNAEFVDAWSTAREEMAESGEFLYSATPAGGDGLSDTIESPFESETEEIETPNWMLIAIEGLEADMADKTGDQGNDS